jgi:tRNA-2-methylthio-N6-dimethylallyladenosine synthase
MQRRVYIQTVGCQMNVLDSELAAADLRQAGCELVHSLRQADTILFNTCSVRQHAEDKIYSALGRLKHVKEHRPGTIIGVLGCMAQKDRQKIFQRAPHVDLVIGPGQLAQLPALIERIAAGSGPILEISLDRRGAKQSAVLASFRNYNPVRTAETRAARCQALVRIMFGCDQFCTYCVVPAVRGPEQSRPADEIIEEVRRLADDGCLEVTLLGQTVNSYHDDTSGRTLHLADLLERIDAVAGLRRIKFVTNHPNYMTDDLLQAVRDLPKVSPYLHVPAQSGSSAILQRMKRGYTVEQYREMLARIREILGGQTFLSGSHSGGQTFLSGNKATGGQTFLSGNKATGKNACPPVTVTSDFIVGFCGETEEDFQQTVELVRSARFKNSFIFKYSPRPGTKAAELYPDDVPEPVKRRRNNELLALQNAVSLEENQSFLNRTVEILVEGPSKAALKSIKPRPPVAPQESVQLTGRTPCDRIVVFHGPAELSGRILNVTIERFDVFTLFGKLSTMA